MPIHVPSCNMKECDYCNPKDYRTSARAQLDAEDAEDDEKDNETLVEEKKMNKWPIICGALLCGLIISFYVIARNNRHATLETCYDTVQWVGGWNDSQKCPIGTVMSLETVGGNILMRCTCSKDRMESSSFGYDSSKGVPSAYEPHKGNSK